MMWQLDISYHIIGTFKQYSQIIPDFLIANSLISVGGNNDRFSLNHLIILLCVNHGIFPVVMIGELLSVS